MEAVAGLKRCDCARGVALTAASQPAVPRQPNLTINEAKALVEMLSAIPDYYPTEAGARMIIGDELRSICESMNDGLWLVKRMARLYRKWPGVGELRLVYCASGRRPLDAIAPLGISELYPEGFPAEPGTTARLAPASAPIALPPGKVSADPEISALVGDLARRKRL
jgi:hypothetical protein